MLFRLLFASLMLLFLASNQSLAQKPEKKKFLNISGVLEKKGAETLTVGDFPNLNKVNYYYDKRTWSQIQKFESRKAVGSAISSAQTIRKKLRN